MAIRRLLKDDDGQLWTEVLDLVDGAERVVRRGKGDVKADRCRVVDPPEARVLAAPLTAQPHAAAHPVPKDETVPVAAIVTCHNYERYLDACLASLEAQTVPFTEVVVVDDASDNGAAVKAICERHDARYERVDFRDVCRARDHGLALTSATIVSFVDADNTLGPAFVERLLPLLADRTAALAYAPAHQMDETGAVTGRYDAIRPVTRDALRRENRIDTCCLLRRDAVLDAGGWGPGSGPGRFHDWHLWLRVTGLGWPVRYCSEPVWNYRRHAASMSLTEGGPDKDHAARVRVMQAVFNVSVVTTFCGREWALERTLNCYQQLGWDPGRLHLLAVDNSRSRQFSYHLRQRLDTVCRDWAGVTILRDDTPAPEGTTAAEFAGSADLRIRYQEQLGCTVRRLYAELVAGALTPSADLLFTLEDDVEFTEPEPLPKLLGQLAARAAAVGGIVNVRFTSHDRPGPIAWQVVSEEPWRHTRAVDPGPDGEPFEVGGLAYGCTLWRAEVWRTLQAHRLRLNDGPDAPPWQDLTFAGDLRRAGWKLVIHPGVRTRHWREDESYV